MRKRGDLDRLNRLEIGRAVKKRTAAPLRIRRTDNVVAVVFGKPRHPAVDRVKIQVAEPALFIDFKNRLLPDCEMNTVRTLRHMTPGIFLVARHDGDQQNGPPVGRHHLSGIEYLIRRTPGKFLRRENRIVFITGQ